MNVLEESVARELLNPIRDTTARRSASVREGQFLGHNRRRVVESSWRRDLKMTDED